MMDPGENQVDTGNTSIGNEYLIAIEDVVIPITDGRGFNGCSIGSGIGFGEAEGADLFPGCKGDQELVMLVIISKRVDGVS